MLQCRVNFNQNSPKAQKNKEIKKPNEQKIKNKKTKNQNKTQKRKAAKNMKFTDAQKKIYQKNLKAIKGGSLERDFKRITKPKEFALHFGGDSLDINIECLKDGRFIYQNALAELTDKVALYQNKYILYPYLYFYGFGNGLLYKVLLQNEQLKCLVVFEENAELLWLAFHLIDFSKEIRDIRLIIYTESIENANLFLNVFFNNTKVGNYAKTYFLEPHSFYYEDKFSDEIIKTNKVIVDLIYQRTITHGNASPDALEGIQNRAQNFAAQITHICAKDFARKHFCPGETAICVATGPSLTKQLPLLKAVQEKVAIFSADSAYPILMQNDIIPDYVFMMERSDFTAEFFKHDFKGRDKNTIFLVADMVHPNAIKYLEKFKRQYMVFSKHLANTYIQLRHYPKLKGFCVSQNALETAPYLLYENVLLIGQDLAYADNGASHAKNYQNDEFYESDLNRGLEIEAYGGKGMVRTNVYWKMFKTEIEIQIKNIQIFLKKLKIYNCTEGGARIENTIEMPFKKACDKFLKDARKKHFELPKALPKIKQKELLLSVYARTKKQILKSEEFAQKNADRLEALKHTFEVLNSVNSTSFETNKPYFEECDRIITEIKNELEDKQNAIYVYEVLEPTLFQFEQSMSALFVYNPQSEAEKNEKMFIWIVKHFEWLEQIVAWCREQKIALEKSLAPLQKAIKKAGKDAEKKMKMIDEKDRWCFMFL